MKEENRRQKNKKRKDLIVLKVLFIFFLIILIIAIVIVVKWIRDSREIKDLSKTIEEEVQMKEIEDNENTEIINPPFVEESDYWYYIKQNLLEVEFDDLIAKNSDTVGWIQVLNTNINYPVVQTKDNLFYLTHAFNKEKNDAGWVYMDYRNNPVTFDNNTVIYAHSRYDTTMFGSLKKTLTKSWYKNKDNHIIRFSTPYENTLWQVFSVYTTPSESYYITPSFTSVEEYTKFLITLKKRSIYDFQTALNIEDKILTLSTCQDNYGNRIVLHAKLIKKEVRI